MTRPCWLLRKNRTNTRTSSSVWPGILLTLWNWAKRYRTTSSRGPYRKAFDGKLLPSLRVGFTWPGFDSRALTVMQPNLPDGMLRRRSNEKNHASRTVPQCRSTLEDHMLRQ